MAAPWREGEHCIFGDTARAVGSLAYAVNATKDHYLALYRFSLAYRATCYLLPLAWALPAYGLSEAAARRTGPVHQPRADP